METNALLDLVHEAQGQLWVDKINKTYSMGHLCPWVSTFHPKNLPCQLEGTFHHGAFNAGVKMVFSYNTAWMDHTTVFLAHEFSESVDRSKRRACEANCAAITVYVYILYLGLKCTEAQPFYKHYAQKHTHIHTCIHAGTCETTVQRIRSFQNNLHIMDIPIELMLCISGYLSPPDVLSLAATCRKHHNAWQQHTNTIYNLISHSIQCEADARGLLADQGILPVDSAMTVAGFLQLRRNAHVVEKIVERFGREFIIPYCCPLGMHLLH